MKKFVKSMLSLLLSLVMAFSAFVAAPISNINIFGVTASASGMTLAQLKAKYPAGKYWNGGNADSCTSSPCTHHANGCTWTGSCGCNSFKGLASQCMGFAFQLAYLVYGGNPYYDFSKNYDVSALNTLKSGDIVRYENNGHSIFVTAVNGDTVTFADCNAGNTCIIRWNATISKSTLRSTFTYVATAPYEFVSSHTHSYTSTVTKQATCTATGTKTFKCSCGDTYTETIKAKGHSYKTTVVAPTETDKGYTLHKCSACSYSYKDNYINPPTYKDGWYYCDALPSGITTDNYTIQYKHYYEKIQENSPGTGWKNAGVAKTEWKNSGGEYISYFDLETSDSRILVKSIYFHFCGPNTGKSVHYGMEGNYVHWDGVDPSKVSAEFAEYDADSGYPVYLLSWSDGSRVWCQSGVTCDGSNGSHGQRGLAWYKENTYQDRVKVTTYKFTKETDYVAKKDTTATTITYRYQSNHTHTVVTDKAVAATCTTAGKTAGSHCSSCGAVITAQTTVAALGHSYGSWTTTTAPTCTKDGIQTRTCSRCNAKETKAIAATGHKDGEWKVTTAPTATSTGVKTLYCAVCGAEMRTEIIPVLEAYMKSLELKDKNITINRGQSYQVNGTVTYYGDVKYKSIEYVSNNPSVAQVDSSGVVKGVNRGTAIVTCTVTDEYGNSVSDSCTVNVTFTFGQWLLYIICFGWIWM